MNELFTRIVSGVIYAAAIILALWSGKLATNILFIIFGLICLFELQNLLNFKNYVSYFVFPIALIFFNYFNVNDEITFLFIIACLFVKLLLLRDLFSLKGRNAFRQKKHLITLMYIVPSMVFLTLIPKLYPDYNTYILLYVFILMWINDSFAFLIGKHFGKQKLFAKISPKKTVEGFLAGFTFTIIGGILISYFNQTLSFYNWVVVGILVSVFGNLGDLVQSKFKRKALVKDSGKIMPGHGGVFDRMDSIIFSSTFVFGFLFVINHVS
ncbi:phosphatidate cytidylyltransferase [Mesohalobacter halotolerans]|uniref:Phosphatidate cytidylyltransferase n=1 Tax=Mesohalobacter halotolerans TaxID=1883405 RepID=A0A4U5TNR2_9FLAO|nr:phosphatidate cytidylyltransferase [Mesohalobacter halotolerans]MBS3737877.1 phosphatidate cytidylyltransferase [Psychroflexus sp.]TKS55503.1 phosphatidate cytidylyltransferase [Mesohalobacter halotolerans]